jgi:hypothetical protein
LDFIAHPEVSSVVVEHLIQTLMPMAMHEYLKAEMIGANAGAKAYATSVEKLWPKMVHQEERIIKLQQDVKVALKKCPKRPRDEL